MEKMRILFTCQNFNYCTESARYVYELSVELVKRGHDVTVLSEIGGEISAAAKKNGVRCIDFSNVFDIQDEKFDIVDGADKESMKIASTYFDAKTRSTFGHLSLFPVDFNRFNTKNKEAIEQKKISVGQKRPIVIFIGVIDRESEYVIKDLSKRSGREHFDLWVVGMNLLSHVLPASIKMMPETFFIEKWIEMADEVAGIGEGMLTYSSLACGKPYHEYKVYEDHTTAFQVKHPEKDLSEFSVDKIVDKLLEIYK